MKWIGQHIYDYVSRFRDDVFLEDISTGTIASGGHLGLDSNNKIVKAVDGGGSVTSVTAGDGMTQSGTSTVNPTLNVVAGNFLDVQADQVDVDLSEAVEASIVDGDYMLFLDGGATGTLKKEALHDIATKFAGTGLTATSSVIGVNANQAGITNIGTLGSGLTIEGGISVENTNADGLLLHLGQSTLEDQITSGSGTNAMMHSMTLEGPILAAANPSVTITSASTLYIKGPPTEGSNVTITNPYALWVDDGLVKFDGALTVVGTITGGFTGDLNGQAATVATIAGLAPNTATTQATQAAITTCANLTTTGTIATGAWNATKIASDKVTHSQIINLKGFCTLTTSYQYAEDMEDTKAPYEMAINYGSGTIDNSTEVTQASLFRAGGFHVPFAATINSIQLQTTCNEPGTVTAAIVEYRPSDSAGDTNDYPRTVYKEIAITSDDNNNKVDTTNATSSFGGSGAIPAGSHLIIMAKGDGTSATGKAFFSAAIEITW